MEIDTRDAFYAEKLHKGAATTILSIKAKLLDTHTMSFLQQKNNMEHYILHSFSQLRGN